MPYFFNENGGKSRAEQLQALANGGHAYIAEAKATKAPPKLIAKAASFTVAMQTAANELFAEAKALLPSICKKPY